MTTGEDRSHDLAGGIPQGTASARSPDWKLPEAASADEQSSQDFALQVWLSDGGRDTEVCDREPMSEPYEIRRPS